jgi:hypothetical protein
MAIGHHGSVSVRAGAGGQRSKPTPTRLRSAPTNPKDPNHGDRRATGATALRAGPGVRSGSCQPRPANLDPCA